MFRNVQYEQELQNTRIRWQDRQIGQTIRRWEREGKLVAKRLPSGQRYFDESDVKTIMGYSPSKKDVVVYCRVSSAGQKDDLASQFAAMEAYCLAGSIPVDLWIREVGGGMNFNDSWRNSPPSMLP